MLLFKRRDTRAWVLGLAGFPGLVCLTWALGTPDWWPALQVPLALAVSAATGALVLWWRRGLPPDIDLERLDPAAAERLITAGTPPNRTLLYVEFAPDWLRRYRLEVLVDGERVGQLPPGTALLLPLPLGPHTVAAYLDRPVTTVTEQVNSIPGGYAGVLIRNRGSRAIELVAERDRATAPALRKGVRLLRPAVPDA